MRILLGLKPADPPPALQSYPTQSEHRKVSPCIVIIKKVGSSEHKCGVMGGGVGGDVGDGGVGGQLYERVLHDAGQELSSNAWLTPNCDAVLHKYPAHLLHV